MDDYFMKIVLGLAKKGEGKVSPNPLVGAIIVKDNKIISRGYHKEYGGNHAEIEAIKSAKEPIEGSTIYVNLEPCSHYGKTPPCVEAIIKNKFKRVVVGMKDPNTLVNGNGIKILRENNIEVRVGVLLNECEKLNEIFVNNIKNQKPFVTLKYAMTLDGKIATHIKDSKYITCSESRDKVHIIRNKYSTIMVGINTVLKDNPYLNCRKHYGVDPTPIVVDSTLKTHKDLNIFKVHKKVIIATISDDKDKINALKDIGATIIKTSKKNDKVDLEELMVKLKNIGIDSILLEGGSTLNYSMIESNLVDKVMVFISPKILGGEKAPTPVGGRGIDFVRDAIKLKNASKSIVGEDIVVEGYL